MKKISGPVGKKIVVAVALVAILVGSGAYALAASGKEKAAQTPEKIIVTQGPAASIDYTIYDLFLEPYHEWWADRTAYYATDFIITDSTTDGVSSQLFLPSRSPQLAFQGLIYAPYRYAIDAVDLTTADVGDPEFMPILGPAPAASASASIDLYFQYLYQTWWNDYWIATWSGDVEWVGDDFYAPGGTDGYYLGMTSTITMNREAAYSWLNLPTGADVATWWAANKETTEDAWAAFIDYEGNTRLDIYCGYEWSLDTFGLYMDLVELGPDSVQLQLDHISWGYEILMVKWLTDLNVSPGLEPWMEDFHLQADFGETTSDLSTDGVAQYSMHAVKANGTADGAAWVFEPARVDYIYKVGHPSLYTPYRTLKYTSWNSGDTLFGTQVPYEQTPAEFDLDAGETMTFVLPTNPVFAYKGVGLTETDYADLAAGDNSAFVAIQSPGLLGLGYWLTGWPEGTGVDLTSMYHINGGKFLTIQGPQNFSSNVNSPTTIYHGTPWIEFWIDPSTPIANAGPDQNNVVTETPVYFDGTGSTDDVRIYNYTWVIEGLGVTLYGPTPNFSFLALGDYTVTLTVEDSVGRTDSDVVIIHVTILIPEFPVILLPIAATLALVVTFKKRRG